MNWGRILAAITMVLSLGAAIGFLVAGDVRKAVYWAAATVINSTFVF